jgi:hypothetical protein
LLLVVSCGGKLTVDRNAPGAVSNNGTTETSGGARSGGGNGNDGGKSVNAGSAGVGAASNEGATAAVGGASTPGGDAAVGGSVVATSGSGNLGAAGGAGGEDAQGGAVAVAGAPSCDAVSDVTGDCHRVDCDNTEHAVVVVDQTDVPKLDNPCLAGTCNAAGKTGSELRDARVSCDDGAGDVMCDGKGTCVECTQSGDCGAKSYCSKAGKCGPEPCTDVDCGGACPLCPDGKMCLVNDDCESYACDYETHTCIANPCKDHHQDGHETDADCGGGLCAGCDLGQGCFLDLDCAGYACDIDTLTCISNQCVDHHQDGEETDKDCGGPTCAPCAAYKKCHTNFDCADGWCSLTVPHLCTP